MSQPAEVIVLPGLPAPETVEVAPGINLRVTAYHVAITDASNIAYSPLTKFIPGKAYAIRLAVRAGGFTYIAEEPPKDRDGIPMPGFQPTLIHKQALKVEEVWIE